MLKVLLRSSMSEVLWKGKWRIKSQTKNIPLMGVLPIFSSYLNRYCLKRHTMDGKEGKPRDREPEIG